MMKPNSEKGVHAKDRISIMDVRNIKEEEEEEATSKSNVENGTVVEEDDVVGGVKKDKKDVENYESSPELAGVFYEEILNEDELQKLKTEFSRLKNSCYLDHAGATLYASSQINSHISELQTNLYSNPHSRNPSSSITTDAVDYVRQRILAHFETTADDYTVIFTSGATAAMKMVAETFQFKGGLFAYLEESHTSVVGMRELVNNGRGENTTDEDDDDSNGQTKVYCLSKSTMCKLMDPEFFSRRVGCSSQSCSCQKQCDEFHEISFCKIHHPHPQQQKQQQHHHNNHHQRKERDHVNSELVSEAQQPNNNYNNNNHHQDSTETLLINGNKKYDDEDKTGGLPKNALVVYPAQCNFSGYKYPLEWISHVQDGRLECISTSKSFYMNEESKKPIIRNDVLEPGEDNNCCCASHNNNHVDCNSNESFPLQSLVHNKKNQHNWFVLLDAANYVATNPLNLSVNPADFVAVSFYKMFGFPTGLGALIVRNESAHVLKKLYFGGGTVNIQVPSQPFHVKRTNLHERFEDGTIPFLSILAIRDGLYTLSGLCRSMESIRERTFRLAQYFYRQLSGMLYGNGQRVAKIYSDTNFTSSRTQGPVVTFNLLRGDGSIIGYSEMEQIAYLHDVHLRYGCFCNPGACRRHLDLLPEEVIKQYEAGHVCGDLNDLIDGKPTGAIRMSIGYMTSQENLDFLLCLIHRCWIQPENFRKQNENSPVSRPDILSVESTVGRNSFKERKLLRIFVYPIKSCAPFEVQKTWVIGPKGLLYDREWLIVNSAGVPLTQKREPRLCQLKPKIDISNRKLVLSFEGFPDVSIPLEINQLQRTRDNTLKTQLCASKVCGDTIMGLDCGSEVSDWLSDVLGTPGIKLIRMSPDHQRKPKNALEKISLANHSQYLLLSMGSLRRLAHQLIEKGVASYLIPSWEDTLAFEGQHQQHKEKKEHDDQEPQDTTLLEHQVVQVLIERFRGNLIIGHSEYEENHGPFEEEGWSDVRIGDLAFKSGGPCMRCATICTDQRTGVRGPEPLLTLSAMRNGRANFGIHLYSSIHTDGGTTTTASSSSSSLLLSSSSSVSSPNSNAQQSIFTSLKEKVHIRTIKHGSGGSEDEPLQENGIATVPSGSCSVEKNKTPLEELHHRGDDGGAYTLAPTTIITSTTTTTTPTLAKEEDLQQQRRSEPMMMTMMMGQAAAGSSSSSTTTIPTKNVQNSGIKLKNQQLSSNSSSQSFTLSKSSSVKLANSSISIANQVQAIHIGDPVSAQKSQGPEVTTSSTSTNTTASPYLPSSTRNRAPASSHAAISSHVTTTATGQQLSYNNRSKISSFDTIDAAITTTEKSNSSLTPNGGVKSPIFKETSKLFPDHQKGRGEQARNFVEMQNLIESID